MDRRTFAEVFDEQLSTCRNLLLQKSGEYATDDQLHNFVVAAKLEGITPRQALAGMMAKHTVSMFDMCREPKLASMAAWNEKITDHINYLILLKAVVVEEMQQETNNFKEAAPYPHL